MGGRQVDAEERTVGNHRLPANQHVAGPAVRAEHQAGKRVVDVAEVVAEVNDIFKKDGQGDGSEMTKKEGGGRGCTLDPADPFMAKWDPVMVLFLAFTATVTPWEVAFAGGSFIGPLFVVNRIVDFGFIVDMCFRELRSMEVGGRERERVHERGILVCVEV